MPSLEFPAFSGEPQVPVDCVSCGGRVSTYTPETTLSGNKQTSTAFLRAEIYIAVLLNAFLLYLFSLMTRLMIFHLMRSLSLFKSIRVVFTLRFVLEDSTEHNPRILLTRNTLLCCEGPPEIILRYQGHHLSVCFFCPGVGRDCVAV